MAQQQTEQGWNRSSTKQAALRLLIALIFVPLGVWMSWQIMSPSAQKLAELAAKGADSEALMELVQRASDSPEAEEALIKLVQTDEDAVHALVDLALGHEESLDYLIFLARLQPDILAPLSDIEISYHFAMTILKRIGPTGIAKLRKHAEKDANARFILGVAYENGCHVSQSWSNAAYWYQEALNMGCSAARYYCAEAAFCAAYDATSPEEWVRLLQQSAQNGNPIAQNNLGKLYADGEYVPRNAQEAGAWFLRSAEAGYPVAQYNMGIYYMHETGEKQDFEAAFKWFYEAANQGYAMAQYYVGWFYECGLLGDKDYDEAIKWYSWAVEQGNCCGQHALGHCYEVGHGVDPCPEKALHWYRVSAAQRYGPAQRALARCLETGTGCKPDPARARYWRKLAEENKGFQPIDAE